MSQAEVGPNDIVIHLVNPYKCGDCGSEFCLRTLFIEHLAEHIAMLKAATPYLQIVCVTSLVEQQPGGITVTRDILQINEQQMFELQDVSLDYNQLTPLKALEQAGILSLPQPLQIQRPVQQKPLSKENPIILDVRDLRSDGRKFSLLKNQHLQHDEPEFHAQILNTDTSHNKISSESNQLIIEGNDQCIPELDTLVQQALFGGDQIKGECNINIASPIQLETTQSLTEVTENETADLDGFNKQSIFGNQKNFSSVKGKGKGVVCLICSNVFANTSVLERHQVVHTGVKMYSCNVCFKEFNDISSHRKHSLIHIRQHRCPICHHMYLRRTQLLLHMKQHKKKRFIQFGNNFHEVQVTVTRNADGQLVQEYNLPILSAMGHEKSKDLSKMDDHTLVKDEYCEASSETRSHLNEAPGCDSSVVSNVLQVDKQPESEQKKKIIYRCGHCKMLIFTRPTLSRHLIKHTNTRPFQCEKCLKSFHDKADLLHHNKTHTKPVQCNTCLSSFSKVLYLQNHLLKGCPVIDNDSRFTLLPDLKCQCNVCKKILKNKANVLRHLRVHAFQDRSKASLQEEAILSPEKLQNSDVKNLSQNVENHFQPLPNSVGFHCTICGEEFRFKSLIITHVRMHLNQRPYKCPECSKCFFARQMLKKHQQNHTRPYKCPACNKSFIRRYLMKDHFKKRHELEDPLKDITELLDEKRIQCDICGKTMKSFQKSIMLSHIRLHKDVRPFKCKVCNKSFISDNALRKHSLNHTRPYQCHICNKGFSRRYLLTDHFNKKCAQKNRENSEHNSIHTSGEDNLVVCINKGVEDLPAPTMDPSTESRPYEAKIITEEDATTGSTTYTCEPCDKKFAVYDVLMRHMNTFSKPTSCKYCQRVFQDKHLSISHQRSCLGPSLNPHQISSKKNRTLGEQQEKVRKIMKDISYKIETLVSETSSSEIVTKILIEEPIKDIDLGTISEQRGSTNTISGDSEVKSISMPLTRTLNILKEGRSSVSCPECDRSFKTSRGLKIHASSHVRLFKCEVCDKDFMQISDLRTHAKVHNNGSESGADIPRKQHKMCGKYSEFDQTQQNISEENDAGKSQKQKRISTKAVLGKRRRGRKVLVSDVKSSDDDQVSEKNLDTKDLTEITHRLMQSGTRGRPYSCKMCRRRFTEQTGLNAHMLQNHGVKS